MKFAGWFAMVVGVSMALQWAVFLATGQVPELQSEPLRIAFHLGGEFLTAALLVVSGLGLLSRKAWSRGAFFLGAGMLLYTTIVSPGYFAQKAQWAFLAMFAVVLALTLAAIVSVARSR